MIPEVNAFTENYEEDNDSDIEFEIETEPSLTYAMNSDKNIFVGKIDDVEAVKQAILKIINTERYEYEIYSWDYGIELQDLVGKSIPYIMSEVKQRIIDALSIDERIENVNNFKIELIKKDKLLVKFTVITAKQDDFTVERMVDV